MEGPGLAAAGELQIPGGRGTRACAALSSAAAGVRLRTRGSGRAVGGKRGAEVTAAAREGAGDRDRDSGSLGICSVSQRGGRGGEGGLALCGRR